MKVRQRFLLFCCLFIFLINLITFPVLAQVTNCDLYEEVFALEIPTYRVSLQGGSTLSIKVAYRLSPDAIASRDYPDSISLQKSINEFFKTYSNKNEYWEIVNKNLVQFLLEQYSQISSLRVELNIMPTLQEPFHRSSIITSTRPQACQISHY
ncbi:MAG: hypothetical protein N3E45_16335 [Oscillatoriaceae bacterium SKW80]|nr:hypothetical protein [Oscillatoriaceae bacterium SKYG93]MCX8122367.1 hypothetical protein [Oscillatoriaceae bacterium SKW80]MDW8452475.1 hypothetical protein [Oscillatoriaceae cyanobacterium SKYGB_i_bin93]HIK27754.1 hypothetical protein [Oscillatoriaceae cyanobacterium M7585_C2015_266]